MTDSYANFGYKVDTGSIAATERAISTIRDRLRDLASEAGRDSDVLKRLDGAVKELGRAQSLQSLSAEFVRAGKAVKDTDGALVSLRARLREVGASAQDIRFATDEFRRMNEESEKSARGGGQIRAGGLLRSAAQLLPGGAGGAVRVVDDIQGVTEALGGLSPITLAAGVAVAGFGLAIQEFQRRAQEASKSIDAQLAAERKLFELRNATSKTASEALSNLLEANQEISVQMDALEKLFPRLKEPLGQLDTATAVASGKFQELFVQMQLNQGQIEKLDKALSGNAFAANDAAEALKKAQKAEEDRNKVLIQQFLSDDEKGIQKTLALRKQAQDASSAQIQRQIADERFELELRKAQRAELALDPRLKGTDEGKKRLEELDARIRELTSDISTDLPEVLKEIRAREGLTAITKQLTDGTKEYQSVVEQLTKTDADYAALLNKRAQDDARNAQIGDLQSQIDLAKEREVAQAQTDKINALKADAAKTELQAQRKVNDEIKKADQDYMQSEIRAWKEFRKTESRDTEDYNRERIRKLQDLTRTLTDLAAQGDVAGFITTQRAGRLDLQRGAEDFGTNSRRRLEDFEAQRRAAEEDRRQRIAELRTTYQAEAQQRRDELKAKLDQEQQAAQVRLTQSAQLEKQLTELKARFAREDALAQRNAQDAEFRLKVDQLKKQQAALGPLIAAISNASPIANFITNLINQLRSIPSVRPASPTGGGRAVLTANAEGGIYDRPTAALLGEKPGWMDMVFPVRQSEGIEAAMRRVGYGGQPVQVNVNLGGVSVGEFVTPSQLESVKEAALIGAYRGTAQALKVSRA